ncbi:hypothetical protein AMAG_19618 [Allomyces macrogynus ATCC 38327]|uniref:Probable metalloprotease ARX1 n=1 Tax=Allomyces macrogynus (strain ATCC 38327) TaxID=578462 RepID=A0A0L0SXW0_ALLM3|nr:hypothetical protein AMAG_19618 [Allomyces macrogynus ATCC 38327]|eukprot:KNE67342.1 hypothetical protein AMAG_19618 [Allomyces macrogynus ATCC 38327]
MPANHAPSSPTLLAEQLSAMTLQNNLSDPTVMGKYRLAADICNAVMRELLELVVPGASTADLCQHGDDLILQKCAAAGFKSVRKGVALPTSVNVNNTVQHYAPVADDDENHPAYVLQENDLVKVELGVHVDGYACTAGHTTILNPNTDLPTTGAVADAVTAAHFAAEMAWRMIKPGRAASEIHEAMTRIASAYKCVPVRGTYSTRIQRYTLDAGNHLYNAIDPEATDTDGHKIKQEDFQFSVNEAYDQLPYVCSDHEMPVELATLLFLDQPNALRVPPVPAAQSGGVTPLAEGSSGGSRRRSRSRKRSKSRGSSVDAREPL